MGFNLKEQIAVARGLKKSDLVLNGGRIVNVFSGEIYTADVAIHQGLIAGLGNYDGKRSIDVSSKFILPGFIDSHVHLESSLLTPVEYAKAALPHGTTAVVADPHEIANVLGKKGIRYFLDTTEGLPLDFYFMLPSCVPATKLETSGAKLTGADLAPFLKHKRAFGHTVIDGHAPGLSGRDLAAYIGAGMASDHECVSAEEATEKVRLGMTVFIREGSAAKDLEALLPAITPANSRFFCFCTDDLQAKDLLQGGVNAVLRKAVRLGLDPVIAVQMATINPALHFGLKRTGAVLPGYAANIAVIDNLESFMVEKVFKNGKLVAVKGGLTETVRRVSHAVARNTVRTRSLNLDDIRLKAKSDKARVIELIPDQIETKQAILPVTTKHGYVSSDTGRDVLRLLVVERHKATGNIGFGLVKGFGLRSGALASTVAHDSHNIIVVGVDDRDILKAIREIKKTHGGLAVVNDGKVLASLPLPVAGLMSEKHANAVAEKIAVVHEAAKQLGVTTEGPFSAMAFLALLVIPELKLTDKGLVDVKKFEIVDLFV